VSFRDQAIASLYTPADNRLEGFYIPALKQAVRYDRVTGYYRSSSLVVAAAGVMVAVFLTFALSGPLAPKEMGIILAVAVFLDALCIRMILLPVVLRLTGHGAWYQPKWLGRILPNVHFSH